MREREISTSGFFSVVQLRKKIFPLKWHVKPMRCHTLVVANDKPILQDNG